MMEGEKKKLTFVKVLDRHLALLGDLGLGFDPLLVVPLRMVPGVRQ